jgi:hypothetical protein
VFRLAAPPICISPRTVSVELDLIPADEAVQSVPPTSAMLEEMNWPFAPTPPPSPPGI